MFAVVFDKSDYIINLLREAVILSVFGYVSFEGEGRLEFHFLYTLGFG